MAEHGGAAAYGKADCDAYECPDDAEEMGDASGTPKACQAVGPGVG